MSKLTIFNIFEIFSCVGKIKAAKYLLKHGANVDAKDKHGVTPLMRAGEYGHEDMTKLLIQHEASVNLVDNYQTTAAGWARSRGNDFQIRKCAVQVQDSQKLTNKIL